MSGYLDRGVRRMSDEHSHAQHSTAMRINFAGIICDYGQSRRNYPDTVDVEFRIDGSIFNECAAIGIYIEGPLPPISYRCYVGVLEFTALCPNTRATVTLSSQQVVAANDTAGNHFFQVYPDQKN